MSTIDQASPSNGTERAARRTRRFGRRLALSVGIAALGLPLIVPAPAYAWWVRPVYVAPPVVYAPPPVYYAPPAAYYVPRPVYVPPTHWVPGHYNWRGFWIPGHWAP
jgi:hypothetical protein